jgi:hypothetical protein
MVGNGTGGGPDTHQPHWNNTNTRQDRERRANAGAVGDGNTTVSGSVTAACSQGLEAQ